MAQADIGKGRRAPAVRSLSDVVDDCLKGRARGVWPVSVALTVRAVRGQAPDCDLTDRDLADLIAIRAVENGRNVIFDADLLGAR